MNIFVLDTNPSLAAQYHCDKHVIKMILESAQLLSTALGHGYKPTHVNHPCSIWVRKSRDNALWLIDLAGYLNAEYQKRYCKLTEHKSYTVIKSIIPYIDQLPPLGLTPFAQAMPIEFQNEDPVKAYRDYYRTAKSKIATWRNGAPSWYRPDTNNKTREMSSILTA